MNRQTEGEPFSGFKFLDSGHSVPVRKTEPCQAGPSGYLCSREAWAISRSSASADPGFCSGEVAFYSWETQTQREEPSFLWSTLQASMCLLGVLGDLCLLFFGINLSLPPPAPFFLLPSSSYMMRRLYGKFISHCSFCIHILAYWVHWIFLKKYFYKHKLMHFCR